MAIGCLAIMHFDVVTLDDVKADTIYSQEEITLALRYLCDTRALRARRDYKPRGSALCEESCQTPSTCTGLHIGGT